MSTDHTQDKFGHPIHPGDTVQFVYGGNGHHMVVDHIDHHPETRQVFLHGSIDVTVPSAGASLMTERTPVRRHEEKDIASVTPPKSVRTIPSTTSPRRPTHGGERQKEQ